MTTIICGYTDHQKLAHGARDAAKPEAKLTTRPWNMYKPADTTWWLIPSTDWPAYLHGKAYLAKDIRDPERIECGLDVEKGLDPIVAGPYPATRKKGFILDKAWKAWPKVLASLADGSLLEVANQVRANAGQPIQVRVASWYAQDPNDFDPHPLMSDKELFGECRSAVDGGRIWFQLEPDGTLVELEQRCLREGLLPVADSRSLAQLAESLQPTHELNWSWIDLYLGVHMRRFSTEGLPSGEVWYGDRIWPNLLRPWLPWII